MRYVRADRISKDSKDVEDGQIFTVYNAENKWCLAMKMKGEFTLSQWNDEHASQKQVKEAMSQIKYAKKNGWSRLQEEGLDEYGETGRIFKCLYCGAEEVQPEHPCDCRGKPRKKGMEDFILPGF